MMHGSNSDEMVSPKGQWRFIVWVLLAIALGSGLFLAIRKNDQAVHGISEQTREMLNQVVIPEFRLHDATLGETIAHLNQAIAKETLPRKFRFERWQSAEPPKGFMKSEGTGTVQVISGSKPLSESTPAKVQTPKKEVRYSFRFREIPLGEALRYVSGLFDCVTGERGDTIFLVHERGSFGPLIECTFRVDPSFGAGMPATGGKIDAKPYLRTLSVEFYEGTEAYVLPNGEMVVRHVQDGIDLISAIVGNPEPSTLMRIKWWLMDSWGKVCSPFSYP